MVSGKISHQSLSNCKVHCLELAWPSSLNTGTPTTSPGQAQTASCMCLVGRKLTLTQGLSQGQCGFTTESLPGSKEQICCLKHPSRCHRQADHPAQWWREHPCSLVLLSTDSILSYNWRGLEAQSFLE